VYTIKYNSLPYGVEFHERKYIHLRLTHMTQIIRHIHFIIALAAVFAAFGLVGTARADSGTQLSIAGNGQVIVREAKVTRISGSTVTATTGWGASSIVWTINTTGSTKFFPSGAQGADTIRAMKAGDSVSFSGTLIAGSRFAVEASSLKDSSLLMDEQSLVGTVTSVNADDATLVLTGERGAVTVSTGTGTIVTLNGDTAYVEDEMVGMRVRAHGELNTVSNLLTADRLNFYTPEKPTVQEPVSVSDEGSGFLGKIFGWFKGTRGALSTR